MGFYELKHLNIPTVTWNKFTADTILDPALLWTIRVAVTNGDDLNLPRAVGVPALKAQEKGREFLEKYGSSGLVVYYPYFIAEKSGVMEISKEKTVIEAVEKDLWNLVTYEKKNVTLMIKEKTVSCSGERDFLSQHEISELLRYADVITGSFRDPLNEGKAVLTEWSFAYQSDVNSQPIGEKYLVFYELRTI